MECLQLFDSEFLHFRLLSRNMKMRNLILLVFHVVVKFVSYTEGRR